MKKNIFSIVSILLLNHLAFGVNGQSNAEKAAAVVKAADSVLSGFQSVLSLLDNGPTVKLVNPGINYQNPIGNLPANSSITAGLVALPLDFLCRQGEDSIAKDLTCRICSLDCTYVHNKYGGQCGIVSNPVPRTTQENGPVCVCNDSEPTDVDFKDIDAQCGTLVNDDTDEVINLALAIALRARMLGLQCLPLPSKIQELLPEGKPINSPGCRADCTQNHNYSDGSCQKVTAVANFTLEALPGNNCYCSH